MSENQKRKLDAQRGAPPAEGLCVHGSFPEGRIEARELAHEIVEALVGGDEFLQRAPGEHARAGRPQKQREMREIAALS